MERVLPGLWVLRTYQRRWLGRDVVAGLVLTALLLPAGMGYAVAAGLPAITGIYATIIPLVAYALFGPSRILVLGPDSALVALIAAAVVARAARDPGHAIALASILALLTGSLCVIGGLLRVGVVTNLLSKPVRVGYMHGIALTILVTQLPKLLGFSVDATSLHAGVLGLMEGIVDHKTNPVALAVGGGCLLVILALRAFAPRIPGVLIAVVAATLVVALGELGDLVSVVGAVPSGVPLPAFPDVALAEIPPLIVAALGIALVSFADTSVLSRTFAGRLGVRVDPDRELIALGVANLATGFFQGFPISGSASRTPVAEAAGAKSQVTNLVGALALSLILLVPWLIRDLPTTALAAIVISAALSMVDIHELRVFYRVRRADFILAVLAFVAVAVLGVIPGIPVAVGVSILDFVRRAWRPHDAILGRAEGVKGYHDLKRYPAARQVPGLVLFRWDAPLFFANAETFRTRILDLAMQEPRPTWVIVTAEPITDIDTTAAEMLEELDEELAVLGVVLAFAELKDPVKDRLRRYELKTRLDGDRFFPTIGVAVKTFLATSKVEWVDWEDDSESHH
ncbi:MAG: sulfate permease [Deltaproteobacteria bacterium]|nr:sulfate permease [Deltaproteobacteria bacterium]